MLKCTMNLELHLSEGRRHMVCANCGARDSCSRCTRREARKIRQKSASAKYSVIHRQRKDREWAVWFGRNHRWIVNYSSCKTELSICSKGSPR